MTGADFSVSRPRLAASSTHSSEYPLPSKWMGAQVLMSSRTTLRMAANLSSPSAMSLSTRALKSLSASATAVLSTIWALAQLALEPTARNSKRLPVKANGLVRLRSVLSRMMSGISGMSICTPSLPVMTSASLSACMICFSTSLTVRPRNEEIMAGGASLAPSRWALPASMIEAFSRPL